SVQTPTASTTPAAAATPNHAGAWRRRRASSCRATRCQPSPGGASAGNAANASPQLAGVGGGGVRVSAMGGLRNACGLFDGCYQQGAQAAPAARDLRLGEARRALHQRRDLLVRVALGVVEPEHAAGRR